MLYLYRDADFKINPNDVEYLMREFCIDKSKSTKYLRISKGNLKSAIQYIIKN